MASLEIKNKDLTALLEKDGISSRIRPARFGAGHVSRPRTDLRRDLWWHHTLCDYSNGKSPYHGMDPATPSILYLCSAAA
jgi:hypothetical protein